MCANKLYRSMEGNQIVKKQRFKEHNIMYLLDLPIDGGFVVQRALSSGKVQTKKVFIPTDLVVFFFLYNVFMIQPSAPLRSLFHAPCTSLTRTPEYFEGNRVHFAVVSTRPRGESI